MAEEKYLLPLKNLVAGMSSEEREQLAAECKVAWGHLRNVAYGTRTCTPDLAVALEKSTGGKLTCEELCPSFDWTYLRSNHASTAA